MVFAACAGGPSYVHLISQRTSTGFEQAILLAQSSIDGNFKDGEAWGVLALVYGNGADYLGTANDWKQRRDGAIAQAVALEPGGPFTLAAVGLANIGSDEAKAEEVLASCVTDYPLFLECQNLFGDLLRKQGRVDEAKSVYLAALRRWPEDGELQISLALLHSENGSPDEGLAILRSLVSRQPNFARGRWHLATALFEINNDSDEARIHAERALSIDPLIWNGERFLRMLNNQIE